MVYTLTTMSVTTLLGKQSKNPKKQLLRLQEYKQRNVVSLLDALLSAIGSNERVQQIADVWEYPYAKMGFTIRKQQHPDALNIVAQVAGHVQFPLNFIIPLAPLRALYHGDPLENIVANVVQMDAEIISRLFVMASSLKDGKYLLTDPVLHFSKSYSRTISNPMWLERIAQKAANNEYKSNQQIQDDVNLIARNARTYHDEWAHSILSDSVATAATKLADRVYVMLGGYIYINRFYYPTREVTQRIKEYWPPYITMMYITAVADVLHLPIRLNDEAPEEEYGTDAREPYYQKFGFKYDFKWDLSVRPPCVKADRDIMRALCGPAISQTGCAQNLIREKDKIKNKQQCYTETQGAIYALADTKNFYVQVQDGGWTFLAANSAAFPFP